MRSHLLLLAVAALVLGEVWSARPRSGHPRPLRPQGRRLLGLRRGSQGFRKRFLRPPRVGSGKLYLRPLPIDGSENGHRPNAIVLKRISIDHSAPIMLPLAHGSAQLGLARPTELELNRLDSVMAPPAPLAVNRQGRRPPQVSLRPPAASQRRHSATWVYPSAETPLAPPGHWEGPSAESNFFFEPFAERSDRLPSIGRQVAPPISHRRRAPNRQRSRRPPTPSKRKPTGRRTKKPIIPDFSRSRVPNAPSIPHTSVNVGTSVHYPGTVSSADVTAGIGDVIYDAAVDPQRSASRMTPGVGFRLPPDSVEYGGWKPVSA